MEEQRFVGFKALLACPCDRTNAMGGRREHSWNYYDSGQRKY
jgi:hypothetical protein